MLDLIRSLRRAGLRTALLSNSWGNDDYPRHLFPELFDVVVISAEVGMRKPEERIFRHTAALLGLEPQECVFIDDVEANVAAAQAVGLVGLPHREPARTVALADRTCSGRGRTDPRAGAARCRRPPAAATDCPRPVSGPPRAAGSYAEARGRVPASAQRRTLSQHARQPAHRHQAGARAAPGAAPPGVPVPQGLPARPGRRQAGPARHRVHRPAGGRLRRRLLLARLPRARLQAREQRLVLGAQAAPQRRARPGRGRGAGRGGLARGPGLGARAARGGGDRRAGRPAGRPGQIAGPSRPGAAPARAARPAASGPGGADVPGRGSDAADRRGAGDFPAAARHRLAHS